MAEENIQEQTNETQKGNFSKTMTKMGKSFSHFLNHLFGKDLKVLSEEDAAKVVAEIEKLQGLTQGQDLGVDMSKLIGQKEKEVESQSGITFKGFETPNGGKGFVVVDTEGKNRGGAFPTRDNANEGRIDANTSVVDDSFISKKDVLKVIKELGDVAKSQDLNEKLSQIISESSKNLSDIVGVDQNKHQVSLPRALTTVAVVALVASLVTGMAMGGNKTIEVPTPDKEIVYVTVDENEQTPIEVAKDILEDTDSLIEEHGDIAKDIKAYNQEKWEERGLSGKGESTEGERVANENEFQDSLKRRDEFTQQKKDIEQKYKSGEIDDKQYFIETLQLARDVNKANSELSEDCVEAIDGASQATEEHMNLVYGEQSEGRTQHEKQIQEFAADKETAQSNVEDYAQKAEMINNVLQTAQENPSLNVDDLKMLLEVQQEIQLKQTMSQNNNNDATVNVDMGMEQ